MLKHGKVVDINRVHVSLAHAHASVLQATARQHGFRLTGELVSSSARSMAKGNRAPTAHHTMARAKRSTELLHIDTAGLFPVSLGGSRYVVMFVNSASRQQHPYVTRDKSAAAILAVEKRFIAVFSMFNGQGEPGVNCPSHDGARQEADGGSAHRYRGFFSGISWGIAVCRYVCGQHLSPSMSLRHPRQTCGRHPRRREAFHCRHGSSTSFPQ